MLVGGGQTVKLFIENNKADYSLPRNVRTRLISNYILKLGIGAASQHNAYVSSLVRLLL